MAEQPDVILVPVDGSEGANAAARYAAMLAQSLHVPMRLLFAFPEDALSLFGMPTGTATERDIDSYSPERFAVMRDQRAKHVFDSVIAEVGNTGVRTEQTLLTGEPAGEIVEHANGCKRPLIVMGSRGLSRVSELLMGSISHKVMHHAKCPVLIVHR